MSRCYRGNCCCNYGSNYGCYNRCGYGRGCNGYYNGCNNGFGYGCGGGGGFWLLLLLLGGCCW